MKCFKSKKRNCYKQTIYNHVVQLATVSLKLQVPVGRVGILSFMRP